MIAVPSCIETPLEITSHPKATRKSDSNNGESKLTKIIKKTTSLSSLGVKSDCTLSGLSDLDLDVKHKKTENLKDRGNIKIYYYYLMINLY